MKWLALALWYLLLFFGCRWAYKIGKRYKNGEGHLGGDMVGQENLKPVHFIDCGACSGGAIRWALQKYPDVRIDAFEPCVDQCEKYLKRYESDPRIAIHCIGVWSSNAEMPLYLADVIAGHSMFAEKYNVDPTKTQMVKCIDLAEWIEKNCDDTYHTVLKMNVEGAELELIPHIVMSGAYRKIDEWYIDFHRKKIPFAEADFDNCEALLKSNGIGWKEWGRRQ